MVTADFEPIEAQRAGGALWQDQNAWWRMAVLNTARMSWFSADRAILDYAQEIWRAKPSLG
jgi:starch phosphorylase